MKRSRKKDWFKIKKYPHIGLPLSPIDRYKWIEKYIKSKDKISEHRFLPFIHKTSRVKRFRKKYSDETGKVILTNGEPIRHPSEKKRELYYASHLDSLVYSYYAMLLSDKYEHLLKSEEYQLNDVVTAYRTIPKEDTNSNKCNIDFANDVFKYILEYPEDEFSVVTFDISSFFDNLDHKLLRESWMRVIGVDKLPNDHFNVYKNITRFSHVDIVDLFEEFKGKIFTQKINRVGVALPIRRKSISRIRYMRNQDAIAFCTKNEFLDVKQKLLQPSKTIKKDGEIKHRNFGIPQGSPISSVLANIYLLEFDKIINDFVVESGGLYRRYSDDMIIVVPKNTLEDLKKMVIGKIRDYKLEIQEHKTQVFDFVRKDEVLNCGQVYQEGINWNKNLIYLGFVFDGQNTFVKSASLSGFYRKMKRQVGKSIYYSKFNNIKTTGQIFKNRLYKRFSYKGAKRYRKYLWDEKEEKFIKSEHYNWGNFLAYTKKASRIMINNKIENQTKRHWNILNKLIKNR